MTADAAAWSESDLDRRFAVGPPHDEITRLAATLDGLLDRLAAGMRRERRLTAEVSHELRTPLAQITAEVDLALRRDRAAGGVPRGAGADPRRRRRGSRRTVETLMATARQEALLPRGTGDAAAGRGPRRRRPASRWAPAHGVPLDDGGAADGPSRAGRGGPGDRADPPADRRERLPLRPALGAGGGHRRRAAGWRWRSPTTDPAWPTPSARRSSSRGVRGPAGGRAGGAGLGLSLSRRLARAAGGDVESLALGRRAGASSCGFRSPESGPVGYRAPRAAARRRSERT